MSAYHAAGDVPKGDPAKAMAPITLSDITTAAISHGLLNQDFLNEALRLYGPSFRVFVFGLCYLNPDWTAFSIKTSDQQAVLEIKTLIPPEPKRDELPIFKYKLALLNLHGMGDWTVEAEIAEGPEMTLRKTSPSEQSHLNVFPSVEPALHLSRNNAVGPRIPVNFPEGFVCLFELSTGAKMKHETMRDESVFAIEATSPVLPQSVWKMALDSPPNDMISPTTEKITRYFVEDKPLSLVQFEAIPLQNSLHFLAFLNGRMPESAYLQGYVSS